MRAELAEVVVLRREAPAGREAPHRALQRAVEIEELRSDDGDLGLRVPERDHPLERVADEPRVGVENQRPTPLRELLEPAGPAGGEAAVRLLDHRDGREPLAHERDGVVARVVVDDDGVDVLDAREALLDPRQRVVGRDHDADVSPAGFAYPDLTHAPPQAAPRRAPTPREGSPRREARARL